METGRRRPLRDEESAEWVAALGGHAGERDDAVKRLHELLVRIGRAETHRRAHRLALFGPELDDIADQAADDALVAVLRKLGRFRGESRFTTWAAKFVILEVASKISRHHWRRPDVPMRTEDWERLPDAFGFDPAEESEWADLMRTLRRGIEETLTAHQRRIFQAIVIDHEPLDALVAETGGNRNAIYKTLFDARRKLRAYLVANGYLDNDAPRTRQP
jgi:RNA polymerase sigma-70 factor (ECF subfamily)